MDGVGEHGAGLGQHEVAQGEHAHELVHGIHHVAVVGAFLLELHLAADVADGMVHGPVVLEHDDFRVHGAGSGVGREVQEVSQLLGVLLVEASEQHVAVLLVELVEHVGRVVGLHLRDDLGRIVGIEVFKHVDGNVFLEFGQRFGRVFPGHAPQGADLGLEVQVLEMVGKVGGVHEGCFLGCRTAGFARLLVVAGIGAPFRKVRMFRLLRILREHVLLAVSRTGINWQVRIFPFGMIPAFVLVRTGSVLRRVAHEQPPRLPQWRPAQRRKKAADVLQTG